MLTAWALFAMLMAFVGPLISQTQRLMEMPAHGGLPLASHHMTMPSGPSAMSAHHHGTHGDAASDTRERFSAADHWHMAACGYCDLFLHVPGVAAPPAVPPTLPPPPELLPRHPVALPAPALVHSPYAPRAPPFGSLMV
ncbi:hypothetical protein GCM10009038_04600 [Salinicola rhizosphaerae]|uniref:DUF2946 domain-containing protein n=2 Tax=Salinicola rhizosphaerae TaxID=1443141 RepID=A0ABQ3DP08_9GAMM|nr:hypothetical protein GCM10009038_04600 [Salinicola rhizosphaerae]